MHLQLGQDMGKCQLKRISVVHYGRKPNIGHAGLCKRLAMSLPLHSPASSAVCTDADI